MQDHSVKSKQDITNATRDLIRGVLLGYAMQKRVVAYSHLGNLIGIDVTAGDHERGLLSGILADISTYENSRKRPLLSAVVNYKNDNSAGKGFYTLARDLGRTGDDDVILCTEMNEVFDFWSVSP